MRTLSSERKKDFKRVLQLVESETQLFEDLKVNWLLVKDSGGSQSLSNLVEEIFRVLETESEELNDSFSE